MTIIVADVVFAKFGEGCWDIPWTEGSIAINASS